MQITALGTLLTKFKIRILVDASMKDTANKSWPHYNLYCPNGRRRRSATHGVSFCSACYVYP
eukprot:scaffold42995_cov122-Skeletonema_dohrnii-CCMP3373.AAC.2